MATAPRQQAARSRAPGPRRKAAAERPADDDGQATKGQQGRVRSTTGDLLNLVEQLSNFDQIGVTRLARHLGVPVPTAYRMLRALERAGYVEQLAESKEYRLTLKLFELGSRVASRTTLRDLAAVEVERLAQQAGLASNVSVLVERGRPLPGPGQDRGTAGGEPDAGQPGARHLHRHGQGDARGGLPRWHARSSDPAPTRAGPSTRSPPTRSWSPSSPRSSASATPWTGRSLTSACGAWPRRSSESGRPSPPR